MKLIIIGGGAAGLTAAIAAKRKAPLADVIILEGNDRVGRKLNATGNGRGNLSNLDADGAHYHGEENLARGVLAAFPLSETLDFFHSIGIEVTEEEKKLYPCGLQASSLTDALRFECEKLGVKTLLGVHVHTLSFDGKRNSFVLTAEDGAKHVADRVIVATGGAAAPHTGSDGNGYALLEGFGHSKTEILPALVQLKADSPFKTLKGIKTEVRATLVTGGSYGVFSEGEIHFADYGLSGPVIFAISSHVSRANAEGMKCEVALDFFPNLSVERLRERLTERKNLLENRPLEHFFAGLLNKQVGRLALKVCGFDKDRAVKSLTSNEIEILARRLKDWHVPVSGTAGFAYAQVTAGGVLLAEFSETLESKKQKGLYAAGEILNVDGDCGGFNLQWAWSSGTVAGRAAVSVL